MLKRMMSMLLTLILALTFTSAALADPSGIVSVDFDTYPEPTAVPTPTASPLPTSEATPMPSASPVPSATPEASALPSASASPLPSPEPSAEPTNASDFPMLFEGSQGEAVKRLQSHLRYLGFSTEAADGIFGQRTGTALKDLQHYLIALDGAGILNYSPILSGLADSELQRLLASGRVPKYYCTVASGSSGLQVRRIQTRLVVLDYLIEPDIDGSFGNSTENALRLFQSANGLAATGIADRETQEKLFSDTAVKCKDPDARYPYKLIVDVSEQRVYVYRYKDGSYSECVDKFICSTGKVDTPTPLGTFRTTKPLNVWHYFSKYNCWAQYSYRITGDYYFHSVLFSDRNDKRPTSSSVRHLGRRASHGCVRLKIEDAKWIFRNCPAGTTVVVRK